VKSASGLNVPLPDTLAVPTVVPPEQSVGALDCGPKTLNVIVPMGAAPPDNDAEIADAEIVLPAVPDEGPLNDPSAGDALPTTVSTVPQIVEAEWLFESPP
jgi:hypothetical protein